MELNENQKKVVYSNESFLFLLAGAGSGKTRVITERIKYLMSTNISPDDILAITFTHKASEEMKERIQNYDVHVHTFHQFALQMLKKHTTYEYRLIDSEIKEFNQKERLGISIYKNHLYQNKKPKSYESYLKYMKQNNFKDFDDLLLDFYKHMKKMNLNFKYIFIDEFQDTNELQYQIVRSLITTNTHVLAVGDPDQSIYQFRGAHSKIIDQYIKDYHAKLYILDMNYRSTPQIINLANKFIDQNTRKLKKNLVAFKKENYELKSYIFDTEIDESNHILDACKRFILDGIKQEEIAIIYRNHHRSYTIKKQIKIRYYGTNFEIKLLTMHEAKGLEFDVVFIIGLEKNEIPSYHTTTYFSLEEERRLMYVAMTRARKYLYMTYCKTVDGVYKNKSSFYKKIT